MVQFGGAPGGVLVAVQQDLLEVGERRRRDQAAVQDDTESGRAGEGCRGSALRRVPGGLASRRRGGNVAADGRRSFGAVVGARFRGGRCHAWVAGPPESEQDAQNGGFDSDQWG